MENRICSFVIAIVNTIDFWGYVHQTPNRMAFSKTKCQRFKTAKEREDVWNLNCYFGCMKSKAHNFFVYLIYLYLLNNYFVLNVGFHMPSFSMIRKSFLECGKIAFLSIAYIFRFLTFWRKAIVINISYAYCDMHE